MNKFELLGTLISIGAGFHSFKDSMGRLYQGVVENNTVKFYVTSTGIVYQNMGYDTFEEIGELHNPEHFKIIAEFNKWI